MKKAIYFIMFVSLIFQSCSKEDESILSEEPASLKTETIDNQENREPACYGIFTNQDYDCGWSQGYRIYVQHYNIVKDQLGYGDCYKISNFSQTGTFYSAEVSSGYVIANQVATQYQSYYNTLRNNYFNHPTDEKRGIYEGYGAYRGKEPLSNYPNCLPGNGFGPN